MNKTESKYFNTAVRMDKAFLELLNTKDFEYITVTEICKKADVNRSTFYLHYESVADLLSESVEYINRQFDSYFSTESRLDINNIDTADIEALYLITPEHLLPFLQYVKEHRRLFKTIMEKPAVLGKDKYFKTMFVKLFSPIMDRYRIPESKKPFILAFTIDGIIGLIKVWLSSDCKEPVEFISDMISECMKKPIT